MAFDWASNPRPTDVVAVQHWLEYAVDSRVPADRVDSPRDVVRPSQYHLALKFVDSNGDEVCHRRVVIAPDTWTQDGFDAVVAAYESGKNAATILSGARNSADDNIKDATRAHLKNIAKNL
jgi:hypothetical protein